MPEPSQKQIVRTLLERHGRTFSDQLGFDVSRNTPGPLFKLLCAALLLSARIRADAATQAAAALLKSGWTSPQKLADAGWKARVEVLNRSGYARYDESTARMLGDSADLLLKSYGGDLRRLREKAGRDPDTERQLLRDFKGLGKVGVDIFCREAQVAWEEIYPFADARSLAAASKLGLPDSAGKLARLVDRETFPRLVAALIRCSLANDAPDIREAAGERRERSEGNRPDH